MFFGRGYNGINHCFEGFGFMPGGGWMILIYLAVTAIVVAIVLLLYRGRHRQAVNMSSSQALEELKLLYAKGDISEEEYLRRKHILSQ